MSDFLIEQVTATTYTLLSPTIWRYISMGLAASGFATQISEIVGILWILSDIDLSDVSLDAIKS